MDLVFVDESSDFKNKKYFSLCAARMNDKSYREIKYLFIKF